MKVTQIKIHNFRGIIDAMLHVSDYSLLVGANNSGKSTIVDALRAFYEKDGFKFNAKRDFPFTGSEDEESWIEIAFQLTDSEHASLAEHYQQPDKSLEVRRYFRTTHTTHDGKNATGVVFGYKSDGTLSDEPFYGARGVQSGKFGDLIYVPALSKVDEHTKLSGPSALRDLLSNILQDVVAKSVSFERFNEDFARFSKNLKHEETSDNRSLSGFEADLNETIASWKTRFHLTISPPSTAEIVKSLISYTLIDEEHSAPLTADGFGSGFQRHFIFSLIRVGARYVGSPVKKKAKDFTPVMSLMLFEEPEAFLHPPQQVALASALREFGANDARQVICSTHSPHFVSRNSDDLRSIIRLRRDRACVEAFQIDQATWQRIVDTNQEISEIAQRYPDLAKKLNSDDLKEEMESVKQFLWLNPDRCGLFFADRAVLVEGPTEVGFINKLAGEGRFQPDDSGVHVLDCLGKFNLHRFMNLASALGIEHSVIFDDDRGRDWHAEVNSLIQQSRNPRFTRTIQAIRGNLETLLGVPPTVNHRKPQHVLYLYESGAMLETNVNTFCALVRGCLANAEEN